MNKQIKYFFAAACCLFLPNVAIAGDGGYIQAAYTYASMGDVSAPYRGAADKTWGLEESDGGSSGNIALGYKVGDFALELKADYAEGAIESVDGTNAKNGSYNWAALTIAGLYDVAKIDIDKKAGLAIIPYVGAGVGLDGGYMNAQKLGTVNCNKGGYSNLSDGNPSTGGADGQCDSGDDRSDYGAAVRGTVGVLLQAHENLGLSINYDYITGVGDNHLVGAGLRLSF